MCKVYRSCVAPTCTYHIRLAVIHRFLPCFFLELGGGFLLAMSWSQKQLETVGVARFCTFTKGESHGESPLFIPPICGEISGVWLKDDDPLLNVHEHLYKYIMYYTSVLKWAEACSLVQFHHIRPERPNSLINVWEQIVLWNIPGGYACLNGGRSWPSENDI